MDEEVESCIYGSHDGYRGARIRSVRRIATLERQENQDISIRMFESLLDDFFDLTGWLIAVEESDHGEVALHGPCTCNH